MNESYTMGEEMNDGSVPMDADVRFDIRDLDDYCVDS